MSNLKALVKVHNLALRNYNQVLREQSRYPPNYNLPFRTRNDPGYPNPPWQPNNYVKRLKNAQRKYFAAHEALHNALGTPKNNPINVYEYRGGGRFEHSSKWRPSGTTDPRGGSYIANNVRRISRVRNASRGVNRNAATVLQKIWRGRQTRKNLTYPKPKPPAWPRLRQMAINLGLMNNNTTRGYTLTPNNLKKMNFMLKRM